MTDQEWADLDVMLDGWWGQPWDDHRSRMWRGALDGFPATKVGEALMTFLMSGATFRPSLAEVVATLVPKFRPVEWDQAWTLITMAVDRVKVSVNHPAFDAQEQAAIDWLAGEDQVVAAYAARRGLCGRPGSLGHEPVYGEMGGAVRHRLAGDYADAVTVARERVAAGLPPVPDRALLLTRRSGPQGLGGGLAAVVENARPAPKLGSGG